MQEHRFDTHSTNQPSYYVFNRRDDAVDAPGRPESAFYHYDTPQEAIGLFQYLVTEHPEWHLTLGVHKDYSRRADIVEHAHGATVLLDDFRRISPWKDDLSVAEAAEEASKRLPVAWQVDRELADAPVLVPREPHGRALNSFFENKSLLSDEPGNPLASIREACVEGEGWVPFQELKERARHCWFDTAARPKVTALLVRYEVDGTGLGASASVTPAEFKTLRRRYEAERGREKEAPKSLDEAKLRARQRAVVKNASRESCEAHETSKQKSVFR